MKATWNATGMFVVTASDSIICKMTQEGMAYAPLIASAPELLAERNRLQATNAELAEALTRLLASDDGIASASDEVLQGAMADTTQSTELIEQAGAILAARAAIASHKKETS